MITEWVVSVDEDKSIMDAKWVTELVRCKDCRYGYHWVDIQNGITDSWVECRKNDGLNRDMSGDEYCSYGERKEDEID